MRLEVRISPLLISFERNFHLLGKLAGEYADVGKRYKIIDYFSFSILAKEKLAKAADAVKPTVNEGAEYLKDKAGDAYEAGSKNLSIIDFF